MVGGAPSHCAIYRGGGWRFVVRGSLQPLFPTDITLQSKRARSQRREATTVFTAGMSRHRWTTPPNAAVTDALRQHHRLHGGLLFLLQGRWSALPLPSLPLSPSLSVSTRSIYMFMFTVKLVSPTDLHLEGPRVITMVSDRPVFSCRSRSG
jgi:hypothetical protein